MCFPFFDGGHIDLEERRPRSYNEPRRQRLQFVKDHGPSSSEWAISTPSHQNGRMTQLDKWDQRRFAGQNAFNAREWHHRNQMQQLMGHQQPQGYPQALHHQQGRPPIDARPHYASASSSSSSSSDDSIIAVENHGHRSHGGHHGSHPGSHHGGRSHERPHVVDISPRHRSKSRNGGGRAKIPQQIKMGRHGKGGLQKGREKYDSYSDSDSELDRLMRRDRSRSRGRGRYYDSESDDSFTSSPVRVGKYGGGRSRSRGRRY